MRRMATVVLLGGALLLLGLASGEAVAGAIMITPQDQSAPASKGDPDAGSARLPEHATRGSVLFLFGAFCALWALDTERNPWVWFLFGALLSVLAVLILLNKHARDRETRRTQAVT